MTNHLRWVCGLLLITCAGCGPASPGKWTEFKGDGFAVQLPEGFALPPTAYEMSDVPLPAKSGRQWEAERTDERLRSNKTDRRRFQVTVYTLDPKFLSLYRSDPLTAWAQLHGGYLVGFGPNTQLEMQWITVCGIEGRKFAFNTSYDRVVTHAVIKNNLLYLVVYMSNKPDENDPTIKPFFDSFRLD